MKNLNFKKAVVLATIAAVGLTFNMKGQWSWVGTPGTSNIVSSNPAVSAGIGTNPSNEKLRVEDNNTGNVKGGYFVITNSSPSNVSYAALQTRTSISGGSGTTGSAAPMVFMRFLTAMV